MELTLRTPAAVGSLLWSPDGTRLFVGLEGGDTQVVDSATLDVVATWKGHSATPLSMAIDSSGTRLATGADDGTVRIWDVATGGQLMVLGAGTGFINGVAFLPGDQHLELGEVGVANLAFGIGDVHQVVKEIMQKDTKE